ncbi:MAG: CPBP family intramembrane glutamic endopeptidase [Flavobacteriaceae bacterium]
MWRDLINFLKNPLYEEDDNLEFSHRASIFLKLLVLSIALSLVLGLLVSIVQQSFDLDFGDHALEEAFDEYPLYFLFLAAVFLAPLIEELIFRGPLYFFRNARYFKFLFYACVLIFGFYHITNFEITPTTLLYSPLLVAPQLSVGAILGFIRVRFGLVWAMGLHSAYNLILIGPAILLKALDIPLT